MGIVVVVATVVVLGGTPPSGVMIAAMYVLGTVAMLQGGWIAVFAPFSFAIGVVLVAFEVFVSLLQAFIFTILTASYIGGALAEEH